MCAASSAGLRRIAPERRQPCVRSDQQRYVPRETPRSPHKLPRPLLVSQASDPRQRIARSNSLPPTHPVTDVRRREEPTMVPRSSTLPPTHPVTDQFSSHTHSELDAEFRPTDAKRPAPHTRDQRTAHERSTKASSLQRFCRTERPLLLRPVSYVPHTSRAARRNPCTVPNSPATRASHSQSLVASKPSLV